MDHLKHAPSIGLVAGSGIDLTQILDVIEEERPFSSFPGMPAGHVEGHARKFVIGRAGATRVVVQCGRIHVYEGFNFDAVTAPVAAQKSLGVNTIVFTNAAGSLKCDTPPGSLVAVDRILPWRYTPFNLPETITPDFTLPGCDATGAYYWMHGPCYETRAEIRALQALGARAVGMSVAPEIVRAHALGLRAAVVSCITNLCGVEEVLAHDHVLDAAEKASPRLVALFREQLAVSS